MDKILYVSVVRDWTMYERCLKGNPFLSGGELCPIDNREKNEGVPVCYNRFLASRPKDESAWYVFCHEDFELKESISALLDGLDMNALWGPIGAATRVRWGIYHQWRMLGSVEECAKDGSNVHVIGTVVPVGTPVETFDCQCLIVHSSLVQREGLRFDEKLSFDLYVEDFCMAAAKKGIASRILPIPARHWSGGSVLARYYEQEAYINAKYPDDCFTGTSSWILGGKPPLGRRLTVAVKRVLRKI